MNLFDSLPGLLSSATAVDGTLVGSSLLVASGLLAASSAGLFWTLRTIGGLPPGARDIAARMAAKAEIGRVATTSLHDLRIRTPLEVLTIDHLVKTGGGAVVAGSVRLDGEVNGGARDPIWHVRRGRETLTIPNPMHQVAQRVHAIRQASQGALPIVGLVFYAGQAKFANGAPEGVVPIARAGAKLSEIAVGMPAAADRGKAWTLLCDR
ncbi:nuclease-related domain-containing protein, partial [Methylobacterium hispanicum]